MDKEIKNLITYIESRMRMTEQARNIYFKESNTEGTQYHKGIYDGYEDVLGYVKTLIK